MAAPEEVLDELYGAPFDEFVPRRDAAARDLRREKRREEADAVKALRKPALSAWAINRLAHSQRDRIDGLLAAGAALRQAGDRDSLRDAGHDEREAVDDLAERAAAVLREAGHPVSDKTAGELRDTLHAAALDDEARELIGAGRVVEPRQAIGLGGFTAGSAPKKKKQQKKAADEDAHEREREKERKARRDALAAAERTLAERERTLDEAREAAEQARAEVERLRAADG